MNKDILGLVPGLSLEFYDNKLTHYHKRMEKRFSYKEELFLADGIKNFAQKDIMKKSQHEEGEYISPIFLVPKSEGSFRMILNLKRLPCLYIKMDTIKSILTFVAPNFYVAKVDIKDSFYSVPQPTRTPEVSKILL